jgi:putative PIN family toxin of toxin-antitoxin system
MRMPWRPKRAQWRRQHHCDTAPMMRLVVDTDVLVAAMRSPGGASAALLVLCLERRAAMLLSVPMALEYESVCLRPEHLAVANLSAIEARGLIDAIIDVIEPVEVHYQWRPQVSDPDDDMVLETAVNGRADAIVTFNRDDFGAAPARFGLELLRPGEALRRIRG